MKRKTKYAALAFALITSLALGVNSLTPTYAFDNPVDENPVYSSIDEENSVYNSLDEENVYKLYRGERSDNSKVERQLEKLDELGLVNYNEKQAKKLLSKNSEEIDNIEEGLAKKYGYKNVKLLKDKTELFIVDRETNKQIKDVDRYIDKMEKKGKRKAKSTGDLYYQVNINIGIGNPNSNNAEVFNAATVTAVYGMPPYPKDYQVVSKIRAARTKDGKYYEKESANKTVKMMQDVVIREPITKTLYWKADCYVYANYDTASYPAASQDDGPMLLNKKGLDYPLGYKDPQSKIRLYEPPTDLAKAPVARSKDYRKNFIKYYEEKWGEPTKFDWSQVHVHHMRTLEYGGSNENSNLIPAANYQNTDKLPKIINHSYLNAWWDNY